MASKKHSPWSYVVDVDGQVVGAFPSAGLAYFVWKAYVDFHARSNPDPPIVGINRYRAEYGDFKVVGEDLLKSFLFAYNNPKKDPEQ